MNVYYVSVSRGDDSTGDGTANTPWKTINKAIGSGKAAALGAAGARVYLEPGVYREAVAVGLAPSAGQPLDVVGDCDGAGFLAGGYATPATGVVEWAAWSDDRTPLVAACLSTVGKSYVAVRRIKFHGGLGAPCLSFVDSDHVACRDLICIADNNSNCINLDARLKAPAVVVENCDLHAGMNSSLSFGVYLLQGKLTADQDAGTVVRNCVFTGSRGVRVVGDGVSGGIPLGMVVEHCTFLTSCDLAVAVAVANMGAARPTPVVTVRGCVMLSRYGVDAAAAGQIVEDWNLINSRTPRTNVDVGPNSIAGVRISLDHGDGRLVGLPLRPMGTPLPDSKPAGFVGAGTSPATDLMGRARPAGLGAVNPSAGALERHDTGEPDAAHADVGSAACLKLAGPASLELPILVDAEETAISVKVRWDGDHGDAAKPRAILLANPEIGVAADQALAASSPGGSGSTPNAYETLAFAPVTPARAGVLMLRLESRSATGHGAAYFDSITLA